MSQWQTVFGWNRNSLLRRGFRWLGPSVVWGSLGGLGGKAASLLAGLLLAIVLGASGFGLFSLLHLTLFTLSGIFAGGSSIALNRLGASGATHLRALAVVVPPSLLAGVVGVWLTPSVFQYLGIDLPRGMGTCVAGLLSVGLVLSWSSLSLLSGSGQVRAAAVLESVRGVLSGVALVAGGLLGGAYIAVVAWAAVESMFAVIHFVIYTPLLRVRSIDGRDVARTTFHGVVGSAIAGGSAYFVQVLISRFFGLDVFGAYSLAVRLTNLVSLPPNFIGRNMLGDLTRQRHNQLLWEALRNRYLVILSGLTSMSGLAVVFGAWLFADALVSSYHAWGLTFAVLVVAVIRVAANILGLMGLSQGLSGRWVISDVVGGLGGLTIAWLVGSQVGPVLFVLLSLGSMAFLTALLRLPNILYRRVASV